MSDFMFGCGSGHLPRKANTIAKRHGAKLVNYNEPIGRDQFIKRHWFHTVNSNTNRATAQAVIADLKAAGIE
jgi:hypothetical protein